MWEAKGGFWLPTFVMRFDLLLIGRKQGSNRERERRESPGAARLQSLSLLPFCLSVLWPLLSSVGVLSHPEHCALPALGLCCLPLPPPCAGESIRQFTLGATGIPPGYTLRLGIKSGSQWRRSPSYRESAGAKRRPPSFRSPTSSRSCESTHGSLLGECTGTVLSQRLPHLLLPPGRGGCVGSQRRFLASHI